MFRKLRVCALAALLLTQQAVLSSASHSKYHQHDPRLAHRHHRNHQLSSLQHEHQERIHPRDVLVKRQTVTIQELQTEVLAFSSFMTAWFASTNATTPSSFATVQGEIELHRSIVQAWIDQAGSATPLYNIQQLQLEQNAFNGWMNAWFALGNATTWTSAVALLSQEVEAYVGWLNAWISVTATSQPVSSVTGATQSSATIHSSAALPPPPSQTATLVLASPPAPSSPAATSIVAATISQSPSPQPSKSGSSFNPRATDNVAVYFGQTDKTIQVPLHQVCANENIDIVILAFVNGYFNANGTGYPSVNFGGAGGYMNPTMAAAGATGLLEADELASNISTCQGAGKIVLMSLGGALGTSIFKDDAQAVDFAGMLWDLFGAGNGTDPKLRPFGSVLIDGFDIDNESHNPTGYTALTTALRTQFAKDPSKKYYISAAPQCPRPDASTPVEAMLQMDFVWVQFYNNPQCDLATSGFLPSALAWFNDLNKGSKPMVYVATMAEQADGTGYVPIDTFQGELKKVKDLKVSNFGGAAIWDGSQAIANANFQDGVKSALKG